MSTFILSPAARDDLHDIWEYIAQDSVSAADQFLQRLEEAMRKIAEMPGLGHENEYLADETLRVWPVKSHLIIYRGEVQPVQIVRVVSGYRNLERLSGM